MFIIAVKTFHGSRKSWWWKSVDGPCWRAYATPAIRKRFRNLCLQSLALTKVSFNEFLLRYDSMGGSWNISFRYGWFWIKSYFAIIIFLTLGKAGWYCVKKGNIFFFCAFVLVFKGPFSRWFSKNSFGHPLFFRRVLKLCMFLLNVKECNEFVLRGCSASPFINPFYTTGGWQNKNSCIKRSLFVLNVFAHRGWSLY